MSAEEHLGDDWPTMPDGSDFDGTGLFDLVRSGNSPFVWDGFHIQSSNRPDVVARLANGDVNMPHFSGFSIERQVEEVTFEAAAYELLRSEQNILASKLLYHRAPVQHSGPKLATPQDILGRRLFVLERTEGDNNVWRGLSPEHKASLITQAAQIRTSLFNYTPPSTFTSTWFLPRVFQQRPDSLSVPVAPTREFCIALFESKIEATIKNIGDVIGFEDDEEFVGPRAFAAKQSLLRLIPHIFPTDGNQAALYRLVLDHGDFGIHNMSITTEEKGHFVITSLYDWETGCIVPAILSDPMMIVTVDIRTDGNANAVITRVKENATSEDKAAHALWAKQYLDALFRHAPGYRSAIQAGKDARHIWFAMRDLRDEDPEEFYGGLGDWAEIRLKELGLGDDRGT
ncbi:hypothetical protein LSUE1_G007357 [Lachnellula suecica]|uniref:Aminoglycoside phosphotransferase domain-containing protein n=1 Tax=Lachnellula suecica TaxID=602035 RepID=A0A8T9BY70_9HELO|nr:hypothetical protein LSUE1_G007357 [Lachnellula suecica]